MSNDRRSRAEAHWDEVETLIWALLDEQLDAVDAARLTKLIEDDAAVRARYVDCVQLHVDLRDHFAGPTASKSSAIMPNLYPNIPGLPTMPAVTPTVE